MKIKIKNKNQISFSIINFKRLKRYVKLHKKSHENLVILSIVIFYRFAIIKLFQGNEAH